MKKLYFITASDSMGENVDLFVTANSPDEAAAAWQAYYGREGSCHDIEGERPERIFIVPPMKGTLIDADEPARALSWHGDIKQVGGARDIPSD